MEAVTEAMVTGFEQIADQFVMYSILLFVFLAILTLIIWSVKRIFRKIFKK